MLDRISLDKQDAESSLLRTDGTVLRLTPSARPRGEWFHGEFVGNLLPSSLSPRKGRSWRRKRLCDRRHLSRPRRVYSPAPPRNSSVHCGPIAGGDEDIIDRARANELRMATGALCIAWEGSGAARVAAFNQLRFVELRSITDGADADAVTSFRDDLQRAMPNISQRLIRC